MYFYLLMAAAVLFSTWLIGPYRSRAWSPSVWRQEKPGPWTPQEKAAQWKWLGKILVVAAVMLGVVISTSTYADRKTKSGIAAYEQGRFAAAEADFRQADDFDPRGPASHYYLGLCLLHDGKEKAALNEFQSVCSIVAHQRYTSSISSRYAEEAQAEIEHLGGKP